jgi:excinuclease ABC subunit A
MKQGFTRVRVDGDITEITEGMKLSRYTVHDIELVVDRCVADKSHEQRIVESVKLSLERGEGFMMVLVNEDDIENEVLFSTHYSCPGCGRSYEPLAPNMFSFNSPYGACEKCEGIGELKEFNPEMIIPDDSISIKKGGIAPLGKQDKSWLWSQTKAYAEKYQVNIECPIRDIPPEKLEILLNGSDDSDISVDYKTKRGKKISYSHKFPGILPSLKNLFENPPTAATKRQLDQYMQTYPCSSCNGGRLKASSLAVLVHERVLRN